ncbi:hypothetical protein QQP08_027223 [Theobroma cacao]|nr:hypothetical protein QQP08_027223 [Theobroma cacao]
MTLWNHITVGRVVCANGSEFVPFGGDMRFRIMILSVSVGRVFDNDGNEHICREVSDGCRQSFGLRNSIKKKAK